MVEEGVSAFPPIFWEHKSLRDIKINFWIIEGTLLFTVFIWGVNTPVMKAGLQELSPFTFNALRLMISAVLSWFVLAIAKSHKTVRGKDILKITLLSLFGFVFNQLFLSLGLPLTTAGNASLITALLPLNVILINRIIKHESISLACAVSIVISLAGVILVIMGSGKALSIDPNHLTGVLLILLGQIGNGYYAVYSKDLLTKYSVYQIIAYIMSISAMIFLLLAIPDLQQISWKEISYVGWGSLLFSGVFALLIANCVWIWAIGIIGSTRASMYQNLIPVVTIMITCVFWEERLSLLQFVGAMAIFLGLYLTRMNKGKQERNRV